MQALRLTDHGPERVVDLPVPVLSAGEALLRLRLAGICGTDLALVAGYKGGYRGVLGHEYVAEVAAAPGAPEWVGRRVVGEINTTCGTCAYCQSGLLSHCQTRRVLGISEWNGVFADYFLSPVANLHPVPDQLGDEVAVFAEPTAAAYAAIRDMPTVGNNRIAIIGDGRMGLLISLVFQAEGYDPLLIGRHQQKLAIAAANGIRTAMQTPADQVFDVVVEATGHPEILPAILGMVRPRGTIILKSTSAQPTQFDSSALVVNELRIVGSRCGPFPTAIAALAAGKIDPTPLITARFPLSQAAAALAAAAQPGAIKVLFEPD